MRDWLELIRTNLKQCALHWSDREGIVRELAAHLEECYTHARLQGYDDDDALEITLREVSDWRELGSEICRAKPREGTMNRLTKTVCLSGIAILFGAGLFLVFLDRAAMAQRFIWLACMAMLLVAAGAEENRLDHRTRSFWLPGFISLTGATLFLFATDALYDLPAFFREISLQPQRLLSWGSFHSFYFVWLSAQVVFGASAAFFSCRSGGTRTARVVAGMFPIVVMMGTSVVTITSTAAMSGKAVAAPFPVYLASGLFVWLVAPSITLLLGAAPFLTRSNRSATAPMC